MPKSSVFEVEMGIKEEKHKYTDIDQIPAELINPLNPELNPICYLLALLGGHHFSTLAG